jgi:hypothetical protein
MYEVERVKALPAVHGVLQTCRNVGQLIDVTSCHVSAGFCETRRPTSPSSVADGAGNSLKRPSQAGVVARRGGVPSNQFLTALSATGRDSGQGWLTGHPSGPLSARGAEPHPALRSPPDPPGSRPLLQTSFHIPSSFGANGAGAGERTVLAGHHPPMAQDRAGRTSSLSTASGFRVVRSVQVYCDKTAG